MGQKVNPHGLRVGVIKDWDSKWYADAEFSDYLVEDYNIRKFLKKKLYSAGVAKIEIERASDRVKVIVFTAKPGVVIGKGGAEIEVTKKELQKLTGKNVLVDIKEIKRPDRDAQLVAENIAYGKLDATEEEIISAAKAVHAHEFITRLPNGYDTRLEERGGGLSVGQKQLLAFARTMVSMPKILILDEATSSIDTQTELLVQEGIEALLKGRTSFVIAHRLSTIQKADRIFVIDQGGIIEEGNHDTLMAKGGAYYKLQMAQLKDVI